MVQLELMMTEPETVSVKGTKEKRAHEKKKRRPDVQRTNQRSMNMRRGR